MKPLTKEIDDAERQENAVHRTREWERLRVNIVDLSFTFIANTLAVTSMVLTVAHHGWPATFVPHLAALWLVARSVYMHFRLWPLRWAAVWQDPDETEEVAKADTPHLVRCESGCRSVVYYVRRVPTRCAYCGEGTIITDLSAEENNDVSCRWPSPYVASPTCAALMAWHWSAAAITANCLWLYSDYVHVTSTGVAFRLATAIVAVATMLWVWFRERDNSSQALDVSKIHIAKRRRAETEGLRVKGSVRLLQPLIDATAPRVVVQHRPHASHQERTVSEWRPFVVVQEDVAWLIEGIIMTSSATGEMWSCFEGDVISFEGSNETVVQPKEESKHAGATPAMAGNYRDRGVSNFRIVRGTYDHPVILNQ